MKEFELEDSLNILHAEGGKPDILFLSIPHYWILCYHYGKAKYKPRIKGIPRKRRKK